MSVIAVSYDASAPPTGRYTVAADTAVFFQGGLRARHREKIRRFTPKHAPPFLFAYSGSVVYDRFLDVMESYSLQETTVRECLRVLLIEMEEWARSQGHGDVNDGIWMAPSFTAVAVGGGDIFELSSGSLYTVRGRSYTAIGIGQELALGALAHGADAVQAVKIACEHHTQCHIFEDGPQVEVI